MATDLSTALFAEAKDADLAEMQGLGLGLYALTEFEKERLSVDVTLPVYISCETEQRLDRAYNNWLATCRSRSRSIPAGTERQFELSWGVPYE